MDDKTNQLITDFKKQIKKLEDEVDTVRYEAIERYGELTNKFSELEFKLYQHFQNMETFGKKIEQLDNLNKKQEKTISANTVKLVALLGVGIAIIQKLFGELWLK